MIHTGVLKTLHKPPNLEQRLHRDSQWLFPELYLATDKPGKRNTRKINGERERKKDSEGWKDRGKR